MSKRHRNINWKYVKIEWCFLIFICLIIALISDLEYSAIEEHNVFNFVKHQDYRLITGGYSLIFFSVLYFFFLKRFVFQRKVWALILSIIISAIVYRLYSKYVVDGTVSILPFIDSVIRQRSLENFKRPQIYFTVSYFLARDILPLLGLAFLMRSLQQEAQVKILKEQQLVSELNYLKAQLHPHFFFNTINNIYSLALKKSENTAAMVAKLGEMMRYILYEANQKNVLLAREIEFLSHYVEVEKMRHRNDILISFDVQGIDPAYRIEPLLMLPFVENAFKHGLEQELESGYVNIVICQTEQDLSLEVVNSNPPKHPTATGGGLGLDNVLQRLNILYPGKHSIRFDNKPDRFGVNLTIETV